MNKDRVVRPVGSKAARKAGVRHAASIIKTKVRLRLSDWRRPVPWPDPGHSWWDHGDGFAG